MATKNEINFMGARQICGALSIIGVIASILVLIFHGVERNVDFAGGTQLTVAFDSAEISTSDLRDQVAQVDSKATIFKVESETGSVFTLKIKNPEVEEGNESDASLDRLLALEAVFARVSDERGQLLELLKTLTRGDIAARLIFENPLSIEGTDAERRQKYEDIAQKIVDSAASASSVQDVAAAAYPENPEEMARVLRMTYPAANRATPDFMRAFMERRNPLRRQDRDYSENLKTIAANREAAGDFVSSMDELVAGVTLREGETEARLVEFFNKNMTLGAYKVISNETFSPSIASEMLKKAWIAVLFALIGILVYIMMRFSLGYAVASVVALTHDVLIALAVFAIAGGELSNPVVAAFLTIVGYSLNDTIVVFDRIRDNLKGKRVNDLATVMNTSINQTLSRTLVTSLTTLFVVFVIYMGANATLRDFAFPLLIGIFVGTYSSIFVASPTLLFWHNRVKPVNS